MNSYQKIVKAVRKEVKRKLKGESTGHDYWHSQRVVRMALRIGKEEHADLTVLELAGWLHDVSVKKGRKNHEVRSARLAEKLLNKLRVEKTLIEKVVECILHHRYSTSKAETPEDKVLQDADKLDVMGALGIAKAFAFGGTYKLPFHDGKISPNPEGYKKTGHSQTVIGHYYDKLLLLPDLLYTKTAKKIGKDRMRFSKEFVKRFLEEWERGII